MYCLTSGLALGNETQVSIVVPVLAIVAILASLALFQALQRHAFASIQLAPTLQAVAARGRLVQDALYDTDFRADEAPGVGLPPTQLEVRWVRPPRVLQQIDVPALVRLADRADVVVVLLTGIGAQLVEHEVVVRVHGRGTAPSEDEVLRTLVSGPERTFDQDPMFAFRLLVDIALRALSPGINDPTTAVQAIDAIDGLIRPLCTRDLDVGRRRHQRRPARRGAAPTLGGLHRTDRHRNSARRTELAHGAASTGPAPDRRPRTRTPGPSSRSAVTPRLGPASPVRRPSLLMGRDQRRQI